MAEVKTYFQATEPTDSTPGTRWINVDGSRKIRGIDGVYRDDGNINLETCGNLSRQGGNMEGAIGGNHGLAPLDSPAFTTSATLEDEEVATKTWAQSLVDDLEETLRDVITAAVDGSSPNLGIFDYLAVGYGSVAHGEAIPLPYYKLGAVNGGTQAKLSELISVHVALKTIMSHSSDSSDLHPSWAISVDPATLVVTCQVVDADETHTGTVNYSIICGKTGQ